MSTSGGDRHRAEQTDAQRFQREVDALAEAKLFRATAAAAMEALQLERAILEAAIERAKSASIPDKPSRKIFRRGI